MATYEVEKDGQIIEVDVPDGMDPAAAIDEVTGAQPLESAAPERPLADDIAEFRTQAQEHSDFISKGVGKGVRTVVSAVPKLGTGIADLAGHAGNVGMSLYDTIAEQFGGNVDYRLPTDNTAKLDALLDEFFPAAENLPERLVMGAGEVALTGGVGAAGLASRVPNAVRFAQEVPALSRVAPTLADDIGLQFSQSPGKYVALEGTAGAGAVGGGELADELDLGPGGTALLSTLGGVAGVVAPQTLPNAVRAGASKISETLLPGTKVGGEIRAAKALQGAAEDPQAAAVAARNAPEGVLPGRATEDPGLAAVEAKVLQDDPKLAGRVKRDLEAAETRTLDELATQFGEGSDRAKWSHGVVERAAAPDAKVTPGQPDAMLREAQRSFETAYEAAKGFPVRTESMQVAGGNTQMPEMIIQALADPKVLAGGKQRRKLLTWVGDLFDDITTSRGTPIDGERFEVMSDDLLQLRHSIRTEASKRFKAGANDAKAAAEYDLLHNVDKAITDVLESQLPTQASQALKATDARYVDYKTVEKAILNSGEKGLTPEGLRSALKQRNAPGKVARGETGDLGTMAERGTSAKKLLTSGDVEQIKRTVRTMDDTQKQALKSDMNSRLMKTGKKKLQGDDYLKAIEQNKAQLKAAGFTDEDFTRMTRLGKELKMIQARSPEAVQNLLDDNVGTIMRLMGAIAGSRFGTGALKLLGGSHGAGPSLILAQFGSQRAKEMMKGLSVDKAAKIMEAAATDKELYAALLTKPTDPLAVQAKAARTLQAWLAEPAKQASETEDE